MQATGIIQSITQSTINQTQASPAKKDTAYSTRPTIPLTSFSVINPKVQFQYIETIFKQISRPPISAALARRHLYLYVGLGHHQDFKYKHIEIHKCFKDLTIEQKHTLYQYIIKSFQLSPKELVESRALQNVINKTYIELYDLIQDYIIEKKKYTKRLFLNDHQLTLLPINLCQLTEINCLVFSDSSLRFIPPEIGNLINLTGLILNRNLLKKLPVEIGKLKNLTDLQITNNRLSNLPAEIGLLEKLTFLNLSDNQLTHLPPSIRGLVSLETLMLNKNKIISLPTEIQYCIKLETLFIGKNNLQTLTSQIGHLVNLKTLDLGNNKLKELPEEFCLLMKLTSLNLGSNQLTTLPPLQQLTRLTKLYTKGNHLPNQLSGHYNTSKSRFEFLEAIRAHYS